MKEVHREVEKNLGKLDRPIWEKIEEECFTKQGIERPYYHGGKYNGKASITLLTYAQKVLDDVKNFILTKVPEATRCPDHEVIRQINLSVNFFTVFDSIFSNSQTPVGF